MAAAISLTKTLTATPFLGRVSSAYIDGRHTQSTWQGPQIIYPRPRLERSADLTSASIQLNTEWDKWPADTVFHSRIAVKDGAYPFKVQVINQTIDSVSSDIGFTYAKYIEDAGATTPYLGLHHTGFTAPAGGTSTLAFTIRITDANNQTVDYDAVITVYSRTHATFTDEFWVYNPSAGTNGTGTFASPKNTLNGADVDGNVSVLGTNWSTTTGHLKKRMLLVTGSGEMYLGSDMTNPYTAGFTRCFFAGQGNRPRQIIGLYGNTVTVKRYSGSGTGAGRVEFRDNADFTIQGLSFDRDAAAAIGGSQIHCQGAYRVAVYDITCLEQRLNGGESGNSISSFVQMIGSASNQEYYYAGYIRAYDLSNNDTGAVSTATNSSGILACEDMQYFLAEHITYNYADTSTWANWMKFAARSKHAVYEGEWRHVECLWYDAGSGNALSPHHTFALTTGATDPHCVRNVIRGCNLSRHPTNTQALMTSAADDGTHSVMFHGNTIKGGILINTSNFAGVENATEVHIWRNLVENGSSATNNGWGAAVDTDWVVATGKSAKMQNNLAGAVGTLVDSSGIPLSSANVGQYGHTIYN